MEPPALAEMLDRDRAEWEALTAVLDRQSTGSLHRPGDPDWNARDVYAHLARWIIHSTDDFEAVLAGRSRTHLEGSDEEINARWQAADAGLSLDEARGRAQRAFERRLAVIQSVKADRWNPLLDAIAHADGHEHYANHRRYIETAGRGGV
jgi:hypothetical protein